MRHSNPYTQSIKEQGFTNGLQNREASTIPGSEVPLLRVRDIVEYLSDSGFNIQEGDIHQPHPSYICKVYEGILGVFAEVRMRETQSESLGVLAVFREMKKFLGRIGFPSFGLRDITQPESARTARILSVVVSFAVFREGKKDRCMQIHRAQEELEREKEREQAETEKKQCLLEVKQEEKKRLEEEIRRTKQEIREKEKEMLDYHRIHQAHMAAAEQAEKKHAEISERIEREEKILQALQKEATRLRARIVKNPEQLKQLLEGMRGEIRDEECEIKASSEKIREQHRISEELQKAGEDIRALLRTLSLLSEHKEKKEKAASELKQVLAGNASTEMDNRAAQAKKALLEKKALYIAEKMAHLTAEDEKKMGSIRRDFEALREKRSSVIQEREKTQEIVQSLNEEVKKLEREIIIKEAAHESMLAAVYSELAGYKSGLEGYAEDLRKVFKGEYAI